MLAADIWLRAAEPSTKVGAPLPKSATVSMPTGVAAPTDAGVQNKSTSLSSVEFSIRFWNIPTE